MTINQALQDKFGIDLGCAYRAHGSEGVECVLRARLHEAAEKVIKLGGPSGGTEVALAHLADLMGHIVLALHGQGNEPSSVDR